MIRLRLFAALGLEATEGERVSAILAQPKRSALLAFLAVEGRKGMTRRDTLLGVFWPEFSDRRGRGALNRAVHFLRSALGPDVLVSQGHESIGLVPDRLWCDVTAFEDALEAGRPGEALNLYRGDLLAGFYISGSAEFEHWLDRERARLRARARAAAWTLAEQARRRGDAPDATRWARRSLAISDDDEPTLREALDFLAELGDIAGALSAYERFAARLRKSFEAEPAAETVRLIAAIRERQHADGDTVRSTATPPVERNTVPGGSNAESEGSAAEPTVDDETEPGTTPSAGRPTAARTTLRRAARRIRTLAAAAPLLMLVPVAWYLAGRPVRRAEATRTTTRVAVMPFEFRGSAAHGHLGAAVAGMLETALDGAGTLRTVDPHVLADHVSGSEQRMSALEAGAIAVHLDVDYVVLGSVVEIGNHIQARASLFDRAAPERPVAHAVIEGDAERIQDRVGELARQLLGALPVGPDGVPTRLAARTTTSLAALKAYIEAERAKRTGQAAAAMRRYQDAIGEDSAFALAHYGLSRAANWYGDNPLARTAALRAAAFADRLPRLARLRVHAWRWYLAGRADLAESLFRTILVENPSDLDARFDLGESVFHWGPLLGRPATESREAWERVLAAQPDRAGALVHLIRIEALEGNALAVDTLTERLIALEATGATALKARADRAFLLGDATDRTRIAAELALADDATLHAVVRSVAVYANDPAGALELLKLRAPSPECQPIRWSGEHLLPALLEAARGRWPAADAELDALGACHPAHALEYRAMLATLPFRSMPERERAALRDSLGVGAPKALADGTATASVPRQELVPSAVPTPSPGDTAAPGQRGIRPTMRLYLQGLLSLRLGEPDAAGRYAAALDRLGVTSAADSAAAEGYARILRADIARMRGEPRRALEILGPPRPLPDSRLPRFVDHPRAYANFLRAELYREAGDLERALDWYATVPDPSAYNVIYLAPSHRARADIHEALGHADRAAAHRARSRALRPVTASPTARRQRP